MVITGFDHIHIISTHDQRCFIGMFENEVCLERFTEKMQGEGVEITLKDLIFSEKFLCIVCLPLPIDNSCCGWISPCGFWYNCKMPSETLGGKGLL